MFTNARINHENINDELYRRTRELAAAVYSLGYGMKGMFAPRDICPSPKKVDEAFREQNFRKVVKIIEYAWCFGTLHNDIDPRNVVDLINLALQHPLAQQPYHHLRKSMTCHARLLELRDSIINGLSQQMEVQKAQAKWLRK